MQFIGHGREPLPMAAHSALKQDYEYTRNGTTNLFVAVEPKAWQQARNALRRTIEWKFTRQDADQKLGPHNVPQLTC